MLLLAPNTGRKKSGPRRAGIGLPFTWYDFGETRTAFEAVAAKVRATQLVPLLATKSWAWQIPKNNDKQGYKAVRFAQGFCDFWKSWYSGIFHGSEIAEVKQPSWAYGFIPGRRRETAVSVQKAMAERLNSTSWSYIDFSSDLANAFGSMSHDALDSSQQSRISETDFPFLRKSDTAGT